MKTIIRKGCFETNSSSTHSITIDESSSADMLQTVPLEDGVFRHTLCGEYGWEQETYHDIESKIDYMAIYARDWGGNRSDELKETLVRVIKEHTAASSVEIDWADSGKWNEGSIDHQSVECEDYHHVFDNDETLRNFLFSRSSLFETDNDNH